MVLPGCELLADAETGENPPQQVIRAECPGNLPQGLLRLPQVFRQQLTRASQGQLCTAMFQVLTGLAQGIRWRRRALKPLSAVCS